MTASIASIAPHRAGLGTLVLLAVAVASASPATATILDSFTDPLPMNPQLPASGARVLFLGSRCDGAACPPGTIVTNPEPFDLTEQSGLPGILSSIRKVSFATYFEPNPGSSGVVSIDPADGGRLGLETPGGPILEAVLDYGDTEHPLNLDLGADGSDRFEIDILAGSTGTFGALRMILQLGRDEGSIDGEHAGRAYFFSGPGVLVVPYTDLSGLEDFDDNVGYIRFTFRVSQGGEASELVLGEIRTASTPTAAEASSWGRIKNAYRR